MNGNFGRNLFVDITNWDFYNIQSNIVNIFTFNRLKLHTISIFLRWTDCYNHDKSRRWIFRVFVSSPLKEKITNTQNFIDACKKSTHPNDCLNKRCRKRAELSITLSEYVCRFYRKLTTIRTNWIVCIFQKCYDKKWSRNNNHRCFKLYNAFKNSFSYFNSLNIWWQKENQLWWLPG